MIEILHRKNEMIDKKVKEETKEAHDVRRNEEVEEMEGGRMPGTASEPLVNGVNCWK